jgi:hypothetical protein
MTERDYNNIPTAPLIVGQPKRRKSLREMFEQTPVDPRPLTLDELLQAVEEMWRIAAVPHPARKASEN